MKKLSLVLLVGVVCASGLFADIEFKLLGDLNFSLPNGSYTLETVPGVTAGIDFSPFTIRGRDTINFGIGASASKVKYTGVVDHNLLDFQVSAGYNLRIIDRLSVGAEGFAGAWLIPGIYNTVIDQSVKGIIAGGRAYVNAHVLPELSAGAFVGYKSYIGFTNRIEAGVDVKYNFNKGIFGSSSVVAKEDNEITAGPLFPVFYSRYADHTFGQITFVNNEKNDISDVEVSVFIEQFMTNPDITATFDVVKRGESFTAELTAFLNENILNTLVAQKADAKVTVKYRSLGKWQSSVQKLELTALSRNSMTWEDDRAAAAFISGRDASASAFARQVRAIISDSINPSRPLNLQYGAALYGALKAYGLNYVIDPSSAFTDNIGTASVDFLKFPYQTLLYRGGDCDDLTILNCALFDALGIKTAMITVPGHILMAFDSGLSENEVSKISDGAYIIEDGIVWIPVEITLCQDSFELARQTGYREWTKFKTERALIPLSSAWDEYKAVGIPDSDIGVEMPSRAEILKGFKENLY